MKKSSTPLPLVLSCVTLVSLLAAGCAYRTLPITEPVPKLAPVASVPEPGKRHVGAWWAFTDANIFYPLKWIFDVPLHLERAVGASPPALDVDCHGEVVDSPDWFINRNLNRPLTPEEMERGAGEPPAPGPLTVTGGKKGGVQPGFVARDGRGRKYIFKLDVTDYPEMATAAEVITDRLYHAAGYNVPGANIVCFSRDELSIMPGAGYVTDDGFTCPLTPKALDTILAASCRTSQGRYRAVAVNYIEGRLKGPFSFLGTRPDDMNDTIPHQHRRELRGLLTISSFLNNPDLIETNTLDSYVTENGKSFLKHYLIDFGTSLGSYAFLHMPRRGGHEYAIDWREIAKSLFTLGIYSRPYEGEDLNIVPSVGFIDVERFDPGHWRPEYPNPAFSYLTAADAFWGARVVMSYSDDQLRAAVRAARFSNPQTEDYVLRVLKYRRDAVGRYWLEVSAERPENRKLPPARVGPCRDAAGFHVTGVEHENSR
ncbi:MAG: hypothetical protein V2A77_06325 [Pseudomonadota bacterium]